MVDDKVKDYIKKELEKGYKPKLIEEVLIERGYKTDEVYSAVEELSKEKPKQIPEKDESKDTFEKLKNITEKKESKKEKVNPEKIIKNPIPKTVAYLIFPVCLFLLAGAIMAHNNRIENVAHLFRSLFILVAGVFVMTFLAQKIGAMLNFENTEYIPMAKLLLSAGLAFVFIEYFFRTELALLAIFPAFIVMSLFMKRYFVNDWTGAIISSIIITILSFILVYVLIIGIGLLMVVM